jgi:hypothetical protein
MLTPMMNKMVKAMMSHKTVFGMANLLQIRSFCHAVDCSSYFFNHHYSDRQILWGKNFRQIRNS